MNFALSLQSNGDSDDSFLNFFKADNNASDFFDDEEISSGFILIVVFFPIDDIFIFVLYFAFISSCFTFVNHATFYFNESMIKLVEMLLLYRRVLVLQMSRLRYQVPLTLGLNKF